MVRHNILLLIARCYPSQDVGGKKYNMGSDGATYMMLLKQRSY